MTHLPVRRARADYVLYLAVLPVYRNACMRLLHQRFGTSLVSCASPAHLDPSVRTGVDPDLLTEVRMFRLGRLAFLQTGRWSTALRARTTILDLNPRSLSAWLILLTRRALGRRTLMWGHLHPQAGRSSPTARLRKAMGDLAAGLVTYTYSQQAEAAASGRPVWVAPNALYREVDIDPGADSRSGRDVIIYVGRFEPAKKVGLLVDGFAHAVQHHDLRCRLRLVGGGSEEQGLRELTRRLGVEDLVVFDGNVVGVDQLRELYRSAYCSASPGFVGLGLTQSLGFGVPQVVARDEPHSPEIELASLGGVTWFDSDNPEDLARALVVARQHADFLPRRTLSEQVRRRYSAETMADGIAAALENRPQAVTSGSQHG